MNGRGQISNKEREDARDAIAGQITDKEILSSMAQPQPTPSYLLPPPPPGGELTQSSNLPQLGGLSLQGYGEAGSIDNLRRIGQPGYGMRLQYGRQF